ncbi:MAG: hypothetical protein Tsb002_07000 [Wenzhouxiangellaceae bacterium]
MHRGLLSLLLLTLLSACATNPLTGESNLILVSESWDQQIGASQYAPMRQAQGGDYVVDQDMVNYVRRVGERVAAQSPRGLPYEFNVLNSSVPNAWALPSGKIAINRGLLTALESEAELAAVLGHEVVHADARHGAQAQSRGMLAQIGVAAAAIGVGIGTDDPRLGQVALVGASLGAQLVNQKYGRDAERESDFYGTRYMKQAGYNPVGAVHLQEKFVELSKGRKSGWLDGLFASHPPSQERVVNNRQLAAELGESGDLGRDRYQREMAYLKRVQPAYEAYDKGQQALQEERYDDARRLAGEAQRIEPREALFYSLEGDIYQAREQYSQAENAYSEAIRRNPDWFYFHLRRGQVREELNRLGPARADLQRSNALLQTGIGFYLLGVVERRSGNRQAAIEHFQAAAGAGGEVAQRAQEQLRAMGVAPQ